MVFIIMTVIILLRLSGRVGEEPGRGKSGSSSKGEGSFCEYVDFGDGVIKYTKDGASYIDGRGKTIWIQSYEMKSPFVSVNGEFAAIGDKQGNSIYICDRSGCQGQATTALPICPYLYLQRSGSLCTGRLQSKLYLSL